jgi:putative endopeptidase
MAFETALAGASLTPTALRDPANQYRFISVKDADKLTPHFSWERFFAAQGVTIGKGFSLAQPKFFIEFDKLLAGAPLAQWQAYLRFHAVSDNAGALSKVFVDSSFEFEKALTGQAQQKPRWKRVIGAIDSKMSFGLGELYATREFTPEAKKRALALVNHLLDAFKLRIEKLDWMTPETKQKALVKLSMIVPRIGYPDHWRSWSGLDIQPEGYFANRQRADKFNYQYDIAKIGKPVDRDEWPSEMAPQVVNAQYDSQTNTINFPVAILQPPFFYPNGDDAINYGAIGAIIGHEISHAFDDEGSKFDGHGNQSNWWSKQDRAQFEQRTAKLVDQFNNYHPLAAKPALHVNGQLTLGENIADLGGLNVAYDALHLALATRPVAASQVINGYTQDQRFFMSWARGWHTNVADKTAERYLTIDTHAPGALRASAALSNMDSFAKAFQCKAGDAMVRPQDKQVKIW